MLVFGLSDVLHGHFCSERSGSAEGTLDPPPDRRHRHVPPNQNPPADSRSEQLMASRSGRFGPGNGGSAGSWVAPSSFLKSASTSNRLKPNKEEAEREDRWERVHLRPLSLALCVRVRALSLETRTDPRLRARSS